MTVVAALAIAMLVPNALRLERALPSVAAAIWLASLFLRALFVTLAAVSLLDLLPGTSPFNAIAAICWNTTIPFFSSHLGVSGARLVQAAMVLPLVMLAAWALTRAGQITRSHRSVRRTLSSNSLGAGPAGSVIVGGTDVIVAAAGLMRPEIVLSTGALTILDDEELDAGIAHERGHIARSHRWWLALAEVCGSVTRLVPGTKHAMKQFRFHLERDADQWAVARTRNPLALASAICKTGSASLGGAALALNGTAAEDRVDQLLAPAAEMRMNAFAQKLATTFAMVLVVGATAIASAVPSAAASGVKHLEAHSSVTHCPL
ncbi:MAG: M48 family metalloprotease [Thermoleophilaceae bacterium]|nr:M48 family metalloprotease [Thermoleophilaceae bacterium]